MVTDSKGQRGIFMSKCNSNNINQLNLKEGYSSYLFNWQVAVRSTSNFHQFYTKTPSQPRCVMREWMRPCCSWLGIQGDIKQMQIINRLHDINGKMNEFRLTSIGRDMWVIFLSLWTSSFHFFQHCRGITGENISLWKNCEVQSFVYTMIDKHGAVISYSQFHQNKKMKPF